MKPERHEVNQARLGEIYDRTAAFYDGVVAAHQARAKEIALELLGRRSGERFLEVGTGTGWALERIVMASGALHAVGLDLAAGMIDVARRRLTESGGAMPDLIIGDATRLPFTDQAFDCLLCTYTLDVLPSESMRAVIDELRRVLRLGGRLVTINLTEGEGDDTAFVNEWQRGYDRDPEYYSGARPIVVAPRLADAGLTILERRYSGHGASWPSEIVLATRPA